MNRLPPPSRPWLNRDRITAYAAIVAIVELGLFVFFVAGAHGLIVPLDRPSSTDFVSFHAAGALAGAGTPWLAYDRAAHHAAEQAAAGAGIPYNYFYYPPVFLLLCAPLARLPYLAAFVVFQAGSALACFLAMRLIRRDLPLAVFLAFPGLWWAIGTGQNALLTASLFAAGTALLDRRPWLAGLCLGALCYKPHFGLLIPVALVAGWHWRAFVGAVGAVALLTGASILAFGIDAWNGFATALAGSGEVYAAHAIFMDGLTSPYGVVLAWGGGRAAAIAVQAATIACAAAVVGSVWRRKDTPLPIRAAVLLAATPVAVPVLMFYDLMLVFVALVWLSLVPRERGAWRTAAMAAVFVGPLLSGNLSTESHWMLAAVTASLAFGLTVTVAWRNVTLPRFVSSRAFSGRAAARAA